MTCDIEIAWAAGLFEGEGCAAILGRPEDSRHKPNVQVAVVMCDEDAVRRFAQIVEYGVVDFKPRTKMHWSDQWRWRACASNAMFVLDLLYPYLCSRRRAKVEELRAFVLATPSICREWRQLAIKVDPQGEPADYYPELIFSK